MNMVLAGKQHGAICRKTSWPAGQTTVVLLTISTTRKPATDERCTVALLLDVDPSPDVGGISLRQDRQAVIRDPGPAPLPYPRKELISRLTKRECELCETGTTVAVHQVTGLKKLGEPGPGQPARAALMAKKRRRTLIV
jgi:hypothetical protein